MSAISDRPLILSELNTLLARESQLNAKLKDTRTAGDGLFNELKDGKYTISDTLPDAAKLTTMRESWIPEVRERLAAIFQNTKTCFEQHNQLHERGVSLLNNSTPLNQEEVIGLAIYNPRLAQTILSTDKITRALTEKIRELHQQNEVLLDQVIHRKEAFGKSLELDKWNYSILHTRGSKPSLYQWMNSGVTIGTFINEIEKAAPKATPRSTSPVSSVEISFVPEPLEEKLSFAEANSQMVAAFQNLLFSPDPTKTYKDSPRLVKHTLRNIQADVKKASKILKGSPSKALTEHIYATLQEGLKRLSSPVFLTATSRIEEVQEMYKRSLPALTPKPLSSTTLERIAYLGQTLYSEVVAIDGAWKKAIAELLTNEAWLSFYKKSSVEALKKQLEELVSEAAV